MLAKPNGFPGPPSRARLSGRVGLCVFAVLLLVGLVSRLDRDPASAGVGVLISLGAAIPLFLVRPRFGFVYLPLATIGVVLLGNADSHAIVWFALVVLTAWGVLSGGLAIGLGYWVAVMLLFGAEWLWALRDPGWAPWSAGVTVTVLAATLVRHEFVLVEQLRAAQAILAERARTEERSRIARELHDVIAHSLTISLLHVTSARLAVEHDPSDAARALAEAERLGRQSLAEVRATMGLLGKKTPDGSPNPVVPPVSGINEVPMLVDEFRRAGADIRVAIDDDLVSLPTTVGSTVYRIVQEALTNATKHALGSGVTVAIEKTGTGLKLRIESAGFPGLGSGMGLESMAERAAAIGGTCTAGPGGTGWLVCAILPVSAGWASEH